MGSRDVRTATVRLMAALSAARRLALELPDGAESNCVIYAVQQQAREGGAIILTDSEYGPWLHAQWRRGDGRVLEFAPVLSKPEVLAAYAGTMPTLFAGRPVEVGVEAGLKPDSIRSIGRFVPGFHDY